MISFKKFKHLKELFDNDLGGNDINPIHAALPRTEVQMNNLDENDYFFKDDPPGLHQRLLDHYKPQKLSVPHRNTLKDYTNNSEELNSELWEDHQHNQKWKKDPTFKKMETKNPSILRLDKILAAHSAPETFHVYSSTRHDPETLKNSEGLVHHPAFLSTSTNKSIATSRDSNSRRDNNGDEHLHVIHFDVPQGHPGAYIAHPATTRFVGEKEFLLPRGLNLRHIGTTTTKKKGYDSWNDRANTVYYHHHLMEIVK